MPNDTLLTEKRLLQYTFLFVPYATLLSLLYLRGYWSTFKINIINYIGLEDILKLSLMPILLVIAFSTIVSVIMAYVGSTVVERAQLEHTKRRFTPIVSTVVLVILVALMVLVFRREDKWTIISSLTLTLIVLLLYKWSMAKKLIGNYRLRMLVAALLVTPPFFSFKVGQGLAQKVITDPSLGRLMDVKIFREYGSESFTKKQLLDKQDKVKFIGIANEYVFFTSIDNSRVYVVKFSDLHYLDFNNQ